jgi:glycosyltransferase involved in cell wall biosynthesis
VKKHNVKYDLIFGFEVSPITQVLPAVWYGKKTETKCVLYLQDIWPEALMMAGATQSKWVIKTVEKMVKYIYKQDLDILVPSEAYIPWIRRLNQEVLVRYWPQYAEDFYQPQEKAKFDVFKEDKFRIMFTGNIGTSQGLEQLVDLMDAVKDEVSNQALECVLIGNGRAKKALIETIESKGIGPYFAFIDSIPAEEIPRYLAHADLAYLSFKENKLFKAVIPAKLQSYMACGVPVFGLVEGVSADIIKSADGGFVISHQAPDKPSQFLNAIRTSKEQLKKMGENNLAYANQHFNKELLMKEFEAMYLSEDRDV